VRKAAGARSADVRDAYCKRRCIVPVDGLFERKAIRGQTAKASRRDRHEGTADRSASWGSGRT